MIEHEVFFADCRTCKIGGVTLRSSQCMGIYFSEKFDLTGFTGGSLWEIIFNKEIMHIMGDILEIGCVYVYVKECDKYRMIYVGPDDYFPPNCRVEFRIGCVKADSANMLCDSYKTDTILNIYFPTRPKIAYPPKYKIYNAVRIKDLELWLKGKAGNLMNRDYIKKNPITMLSLSFLGTFFEMIFFFLLKLTFEVNSK